MTDKPPKPPVKILKALHEVMTAVGYVRKKDKNEFHGYKYAGEAALLEVLRPAMVEAGLILIPSMDNLQPIDAHGNTTVAVNYTLAHIDGEIWPESIRVYGCGNDRNKKGGFGDKGLYKAITGANKYMLFKLFQIETGDDPEKDSAGDKAAPNGANGHINAEQKDTIIGLIKASGADTPKFLKYVGAASVDEISTTQYERAVHALQAKQAAE